MFSMAFTNILTDLWGYVIPWIDLFHMLSPTCSGMGLTENCTSPAVLCVGPVLSLLSLYCYYREDEEEEESGASKNTTITSFFNKVGSNKRQKTKHAFFTARNLAVSDLLWFGLICQNFHPCTWYMYSSERCKQICWKIKDFKPEL